ncbi:hypothetical protein AB0J74_33105 [Asanoa sp. NPDC049573]|uniref:hypothetical protein n=1 Tax=Asanoa sp. NPDC049573 TaxID=3155396 RepID=UPI00344397E2
MEHIALIATVGSFIGFVVLVELAAAVLPVVIILAFVPPHERAGLAELVGAADGSRRLRVGQALWIAMVARRTTRTRDALAGR